MQTREFKTDRFSSTQEQSELVTEWRGHYLTLVRKLGELMTEVHIDRTTERDKDTEPYVFMRNAFHEFIYPPQTVILEEDKSNVIDSTPGYTLSQEDKTYSYDPALVKGRLKVFYDDSDSRIFFQVIDGMLEVADSPEKLEIEASLKQLTPREIG